jgi:putative tricarboxylic transport membrane protein
VTESDDIAGPAAPGGGPPTGACQVAGEVAGAAAAAASAPATVARTRTVEIVVAVLLLAFAGLMAFDNWRTGMGWAPDGPKAGYFPFYLSVILAGASLYWLAEAIWKRGQDGRSFVDREQLRRVLQVFIPTAAFCLGTQLLGIYVAAFLLVAGFMRFVGRIAWWKAILTSLVFAGCMFVTFDVAFDVIMPKGPVERLLGR